MKIKLSKSQWEYVGNKTGWIKKAQEKSVIFYQRNNPEGIFAVCRDFDCAVKLFKDGLWDFSVNGVKYKSNDWKGRVAIENLFGEKIIVKPASKNLKNKYAQLLANYEELSLGPTPSAEECSQVGAKNYDYIKLNKIEVKTYIEQLERMFSNIPDGAFFKVQRNIHEFGTYYEAAIKYEDDNEAAVEYAFNVENNTPENWDEIARKSLESIGYFEELKKG